MVGVEPVPLPQVISGWQSPPCARSLGRNRVNCGGVPPSTPTPAVGPMGFSITVANGPAADGSAAGHCPTVQSPPLTPPSVIAASAVEPPVPAPPAPAPPALPPPVPALAPPFPLPPLLLAPPAALPPVRLDIPPVPCAPLVPPVPGAPPRSVAPPDGIVVMAPPEAVGPPPLPPEADPPEPAGGFVLPPEAPPPPRELLQPQAANPKIAPSRSFLQMPADLIAFLQEDRVVSYISRIQPIGMGQKSSRHFRQPVNSGSCHIRLVAGSVHVPAAASATW